MGEQTARWAAATAFLMVVMGVGAALATLVSLPAARTEGLSSPIATVLQLVGLLALAAVGALLAREQPHSIIAWLMLLTALAWALSHLSLSVALYLLDRAPNSAPVVGWVTNWFWVPSYALSMVMLLRLPNGRLPGPSWRIAEYAVLAWAALTAIVAAILPGPLGAEALAPLRNPLGWDALSGAADLLLSGLFLALPVLVIVSAAAVIVRWRRSGSRERQALRILATAVAVLAVSAPLALAAQARSSAVLHSPPSRWRSRLPYCGPNYGTGICEGDTTGCGRGGTLNAPGSATNCTIHSAPFSGRSPCAQRPPGTSYWTGLTLSRPGWGACWSQSCRPLNPACVRCGGSLTIWPRMAWAMETCNPRSNSRWSRTASSSPFL